VDQARGVGDAAGDVAHRHGAARAVEAVELRGQPFSTRRVHVVEAQFLDAHAQRRVRDGRARAAGAQQQDTGQVRVRQLAFEIPGPARAVGVVADELAVAVHHGVDRPHGARLVGELIEQRDDGLLAGKGDVQPGKAHGAHGRQQRGQQLGAGLRGVQVDELVVHAQAVVARFLLLHRGRERALDARADQAHEQLVVREGQGGGGGRHGECGSR